MKGRGRGREVVAWVQMENIEGVKRFRFFFLELCYFFALNRWPPQRSDLASKEGRMTHRV